MKTVITALIFVFVVAAGGARAQAIYSQTSTAHRQCRVSCNALLNDVATNMDGDQSAGAGDFVGIEVAGSNRECLLCGVEFAEGLRAAEHHLGGGTRLQTQPSLYALVFDPTN